MSEIDPLKPGAALLCKLGSITVHVEEALQPRGHPVDWIAVKSVISDPEVVTWLAAMGSQGFLPVKRNG